MVDHPDLVVNVWEVLEISDMSLQRTGEHTFDVNDGAGTTGRVEFLYRTHDTHLLYCEGTYEGPMFARKIQGRSLLLLKSGYVRETDGRYYVTCRMDAFLQVDHLGLEILAKTFQPLVGAAADHNFQETAAFLGSMSRAAEINQPGVQQLIPKLTRVEAGERDLFSTLARQVSTRSAAMEAEAATAKRPALSTARKPNM
jgi:hypothetical protein